MLCGNSIPAWLRTRLRHSTFACTTQDLPTLVFAACSKMPLQWLAMRQQRGRALASHRWWAARFANAVTWNSILEIPAPRILVLEDKDSHPGRGAFVGDMHAAILSALGCIGYVTNGAVRELPAVRAMGMHLFAGNDAVSHVYAHIFDVGASVTVGGMEVHPGDLLHGDRHGVLTIPTKIAGAIPVVAAKMQGAERRVIDFCRSKEFSVAKLGEIMKKQG